MTAARIVEAPETVASVVGPAAALFPTRISPAATLVTARPFAIVERIIEPAIAVEMTSVSAATRPILIGIEIARPIVKIAVAPEIVAVGHAAGARVGVEPDHAALRRAPFDAVVLAAIRTDERTFGIIEGAGMMLADLWQNPVE
jgi:hypothetical protein